MTAGTVARITAALVVAIVTSGISGCAHHLDGPTLVLRLATPDPETATTGPMVDHFVREVAERSRGAIRIEPDWDVTPDGSAGWDQAVARGVAGGTWDLGLVPGRAWDELGVDSFRALNSPFLITNEAALHAVLESDLRRKFLAGLPAAGVVGLDLFPDELRHPFGYEEPLLGLDDYRGQTIWAAASDTVDHLFDALGATTTDGAADSRTQRGAEGQYLLTQGQVATGNVTFYPKTDALVMGSSVRERLRADQWGLLVDAAAATRTWLYAEQPSDSDIAATYCQQGGSIVAATDAQVAELEAAAAPAVAWLRKDPGTRQMIDAIEDVVHGVSDAPSPTSCPRQQSAARQATALSSIDGTYVTRVTVRQLREAGEVRPVQLRENSGVSTYVLRAGTYSFRQDARHFLNNPVDTGPYTYADDILTITWGAGDWTSVRVRVGADGTLSFSDVQDASPANQALSEGFFASPWHRVDG